MFLSKTEVEAIAQKVFQDQFAATFSDEFKETLKSEIIQSLNGDGSVSVEDALANLEETVETRITAIENRVSEFAGAPGADAKNPIPEVDPTKNVKSDFEKLNDFVTANAGNTAACIEATENYYKNQK